MKKRVNDLKFNGKGWSYLPVTLLILKKEISLSEKLSTHTSVVNCLLVHSCVCHLQGFLLWTYFLCYS